MKTFFIPLALLLLILIPGAYAGGPDSTGLPTALLGVQEKLFQVAFQAFVQDIRGGAKDLALDDAAVAAPAFDLRLDRNAWLDAYVAALETQKKLDAAARGKLESFVAATYYSGSGAGRYARVPFLSAVAPDGAAARKARSVEPLNLLDRFPDPHTLDEFDKQGQVVVHGLQSYVDQRFSPTLQEFVRGHHVPLYGHDSTCPDAIAYHRGQGYSQVETYMSSRESSESQFFLAYNPAKDAYLVGVCDLLGKDDVTRIAEMLGPIFKESGGFMVHHETPMPLFTLNDRGQALKLGPNDRVVIGFQNLIWWALTEASGARAAAADWERSSLVSDGLGVALFRNRKTGQQVLSVANMYGDEALAVLDAFYARGARRFVFMGTGGALDRTLKVGDVLVPSKYYLIDGAWLDFANDAAGLALAPGEGKSVRQGTRHGWVPTLIDESVAKMDEMRNLGVAALDVETRYMAEFFKTHPATEKSVIITVSDVPGEQGYDKAGQVRDIYNASVVRMLPQILH